MNNKYNFIKKYSLVLFSLSLISCSQTNTVNNQAGTQNQNLTSQNTSFESDNSEEFSSSFIPDSETEMEEVLSNEMKEAQEAESVEPASIPKFWKKKEVITDKEVPGVKKYFLKISKEPSFVKKIFEPSALAFDNNGDLFTVADKNLSVYKLVPDGKDYKVKGSPDINLSQLFKLRLKKKGRFDFEGMAFHNNKFYIIDEKSRDVYIVDKQGNISPMGLEPGGYMEKHGIANDKENSGIEGLAIDSKNKRMFLIKERQESAVLIADMNTGKILKHYKISLPGNIEPDLTDAKFFEGYLYLLVRSYRQILKLEPISGKILSIYDYRRYEDDKNHVYMKVPGFEHFGVMEGLEVTKDKFYLITDNNMLPLKKNLFNNKPQLFVFDRPNEN